jgi:hypothetical protein
MSEAEFFAAAIAEMPLHLRALFEHGEFPFVPPHRQGFGSCPVC